MPFDIRLSQSDRIVVVHATGSANLEDWYGLQDHPDVQAAGGSLGLLIDVRPRDDVPSPELARRTGRELVRIAASRFSAVALVARPGAQFGSARVVDQLAGEDLPVRSFTELEPARDWLVARVRPEDPA